MSYDSEEYRYWRSEEQIALDLMRVTLAVRTDIRHRCPRFDEDSMNRCMAMSDACSVLMAYVSYAAARRELASRDMTVNDLLAMVNGS
ncbi:MAG: hypothetical protein GEU97_08140 [Actinophytocola sp.]|nr:hypothetical protein [Actinophytocola sp.]